MHYVLAPRTFLFSHYFYTGLRIATGIVALTCLTLAVSDLPTAMAVAMGALCTSLMDMPSPLRHKFNEMMAGVLLCSVVALLVSLSSPVPWLLRSVIVLVTFLASMMVVYGRKAMPLQFAALFVMMLSSEEPATPLQALRHGALFFAGGAGYMAYAMVVVWKMQRRLKQQVLAEALYELATYTSIKAGCYDMANALPAQMEKLVRQQSVLAERQQASRDLILRGKPSPDDAILMQVHYAMFDLYELVLATHTDYVLLRQHFAGSPVLPLLGNLIGKAARDIESVAYAMTRNRPSRPAVDYQDEMRALGEALSTLRADEGAGSGEAQTVLRATSHKINDMIAMIARLHAASLAPHGALPGLASADLTPFLTQQRYGFSILVSHLRWSSPIFRFALRMAMAISVGLLSAEWLPYLSHGYWTALTIAVILKPSFSTTKQRRADRVIGTVIGCIVTAVILHFVHAPAALIGFLFVATAAAPAFLYIKYRYTAIAASIQILLFIGLTVPHGGSAIGERLLDTLLGTLIATFFSYVLPSWEYQNLPRLVDAVLDANRKYIDSAADLLLGRAQRRFPLPDQPQALHGQPGDAQLPRPAQLWYGGRFLSEGRYAFAHTLVTGPDDPFRLIGLGILTVSEGPTPPVVARTPGDASLFVGVQAVILALHGACVGARGLPAPSRRAVVRATGRWTATLGVAVVASLVLAGLLGFYVSFAGSPF